VVSRHDELRTGGGPLDDAPLVRYQLHGKVAVLTINRPERHNAWTFEVEKELFDLADRADSDDRIGAIGGGDQRGCAGVGLVQGCAATSGSPPTRRGSAARSPGAGRRPSTGRPGCSPRLIGLADATDLLLSGRTIGAAEAERLRLVTRSAPRADLLAMAVEYAQDIAVHCAPLAVQAVKAQLDADATGQLADSVADARRIAHEPARRLDVAEGARLPREETAGLRAAPRPRRAG
jgi:enoyl-CoA hydratase/carnithine racemase